MASDLITVWVKHLECDLKMTFSFVRTNLMSHTTATVNAMNY